MTGPSNVLSPQEAQRIAADPKLNVFVTANAGSGKTKTLIDRVARLLLTGSPPAQILCVTYTKAAAAEMQRRLFEVLGTWSVARDDTLVETLTELVGAPPDGVDLSRARKLFAQALETPGGLKIQTIHAFCEQLLRRFPIEAEVSPRFKVMDDVEASLIVTEARADVARLALSGQSEAVQAAYDRLSIALAHQDFEKMFDEIEHQRFALADYVERVGQDLAGAVWDACGFEHETTAAEIEAEAAATFDPSRWEAARDLLAAGGKTDVKNAGLITQALNLNGPPPVLALCKVLFTAQGEGTPATWVDTGSAFKSRPDIHQFMLDERDRLGARRERLRAEVVARDTLAVLHLAQAYVGAYRYRKEERAALDFADLIDKALKLVEEKPDAAWVLYKLDGGIDHILVDEAQDTAPEQWALVERLTDPFFAGQGAAEARDRQVARSLFVVGDVKQSIFSFQGADASRVLEENRRYQEKSLAAGLAFKAPGLIHSWRSAPEVLRFVDTVFLPPETRRGVPPPEMDDVVRHLAVRPENSGTVELWPLIRDPKTETKRAWDAPVDEETEGAANRVLATAIGDEIKAMIAAGEAVFDKKSRRWRPAEPGDFLILVRRRKALFEDILRALKRAGLPVAGADRLGLSEHILFDDLMALGRVLLFPEDDLTLAALLKSPFFDLDDEDIFDLAHDRKHRSLWARLALRADERQNWRAAVDRLDTLQREGHLKAPYELYAGFLASVDGQGRSMRSRATTRLGSEAADVMDAFLAEVLATEGRGGGDLQSVIDLLGRSDIIIKREMDSPKGEVRVMTVHGAKGLEAPVLFLPETTNRSARGSPLLRTAEGGFLWAGSSAQDCEASANARQLRAEREEDEALRLLYVALTRARDRLIVCGRIGSTAKLENVKGWYGAVRDAFEQPVIKSELVKLDGDRLRFGQVPAALGAASAVVRRGIETPAWLLRPPLSESPRGWASPSALAGRPKLAAASPLAREAGLGRFRRGELIHKLFELLPDLTEAERSGAARAFLARQADLDDVQRAEIEASVMAVLDDPAFAALFGPGSRAEPSIAGWGPGLPEGMKIAGRLDRLVVTDDQVLVCDFKTNRPAPPRVEDADPAYVAQLAAYVAVLRGLWPGVPVRAALLWTDGPRLDVIPDEMIEDALATLRGG